ncbi:MAG: DUF2905 domain-containing protein [Endomicrobiales bacterium]|nr:DUF2905 domain-containing protein [Endomicrobiales bacterium]
MNTAFFGKMLVITGAVVVAAGLLLIFAPKIPLLGKLPGDICVKKGNFTFFFPITTCIVLSVLASFFVWIFRK